MNDKGQKLSLSNKKRKAEPPQKEDKAWKKKVDAPTT